MKTIKIEMKCVLDDHNDDEKNGDDEMNDKEIDEMDEIDEKKC
jgi:hypothetical protein